MWFGLMYFVPDLVDEDDGAMVMLCAWETGRQRALRIAAPVDAVPQMVWMLREAGRGASIIAPRCDSCGTSFDLPLDCGCISS